MDMPIQAPVDNPNADTEWNDILRSHGIIPPKPEDPEPIIQEALLEAEQRAHDNRLEDKSLSELAELEDEEDEAFLDGYRQKRLTELSQLQQASKFGQVYPLQKVDWAKDVTEASNDAFVFVQLRAGQDGGSKEGVESRVLSELLTQLAPKFGDVKFCSIRGDMCIENYPEKNCPTILVYKDGDVRRQIVTLRDLNGARTSLIDIEDMLVQVGVVKETDSRLSRRQDGSDDEQQGVTRRGIQRGERQSRNEDEDDNDWD